MAFIGKLESTIPPRMSNAPIQKIHPKVSCRMMNERSTANRGTMYKKSDTIDAGSRLRLINNRGYASPIMVAPRRTVRSQVLPPTFGREEYPTVNPVKMTRRMEPESTAIVTTATGSFLSRIFFAKTEYKAKSRAPRI